VYVKMVIARRIVMDDERLAAWEIYSSARAATRIEARSRRIAGEGLSRSEPQPPTQGDHQSAREISKDGRADRQQRRGLGGPEKPSDPLHAGLATAVHAHVRTRKHSGRA
jgi:hypothetical protein